MTEVVYDVETFPNVFTCSACAYGDPASMYTWEISKRRDDRRSLLQWFDHLWRNQIAMIGFNNLFFDYVVVHAIFNNPNITVEEIYQIAQRLINSGDRFGSMVWESDRFAPQIDLYKIHHFDNKAKSTSLKALQFAMRAPSVEDMPVQVGTWLTDREIDEFLIPYNQHDVLETNRFAEISRPNIEFRRSLSAKIKGDILNFNDTKIGKELLAQRIGDDVCYYRDHNKRKQPRQTIRNSIALADIIFPYIVFRHPEFRRVLDWLKAQTIVETKGVFSDVSARINGFDFVFGTGGIHGSILSTKVVADEFYALIDIDVESLYPSIAIMNRLAPEHLGEAYVKHYADLKIERISHAKGTPENASLKLALNGSWGDSNNEYSCFFDPKYAMTIPINGQLMLCMLAEWLLDVPTLEIIQINTDGITYRIHRTMEWMAKDIKERWQKYTLLKLEEAEYSRMWIRDVNNYMAETTSGKLKSKGAYWYPGVKDYYAEISNASPSAWHKDHSNIVVARAAEAAMTKGTDPAHFIMNHTDPFDFMIRAKAPRGSQLYIGEKPVQRITRYYIARTGEPMRKVSPPVAGATPGDFKRKNKIPDALFIEVMREIGPGVWDGRIHTANKSRYEDRESAIQAGWTVAECNDASHFRFDNLNYQWYIEQAQKLIIV